MPGWTGCGTGTFCPGRAPGIIRTRGPGGTGDQRAWNPVEHGNRGAGKTAKAPAAGPGIWESRTVRGVCPMWVRQRSSLQTVSRMGCRRLSMGPCSRFWARNGAGQAYARNWLAMSRSARAFFSAAGPRRPPASRKRPGPHRQQPSDRTWAHRARYNYLFHQQVYACHVFRS